jgi:hypothetical protein
MKLLLPKLKKLNSLGYSHIIVPLVAIVIIGGIGSYLLGVDHADSLTWQNYISVSPTKVNAVLSRANPNDALMIADHSGYTQGLLYGAGFTLTNKTSGGFEISYNQPTQGVGFYESSGGLQNNEVTKIHTYINPNQPDGVYTGSAVLKYYVPSSQKWLNGPTISYTIKLVDSIYTDYVTVSPLSVNVTLSRAKATAGTGLVFGNGPVITGVQTSGFEVYDNQPTQGQGFYISSGGITAGQHVNVETYMNLNKPNGTYTGTATLKYDVTSSQQWADGPTLKYTIHLTN